MEKVQVVVIRQKQQGSFMVELALVLVFFSSLLAIHINYTLAINKKGQLDRVAYSLLTILSERRQLYTGELDMCGFEGKHCDTEIEKFYDIAKSSMNRMIPDFDDSKLGMRVAQISIEEGESKVTLNKQFRGNHDDCNFQNLQGISFERAKELLPTTTRNRRLPMYYLSLCYETPFNIIGAVRGEPIKIVTNSYSFSRI
ncbi:tight adherence pilus pseudopilin TadF [Vibrio splendidus]|uniref:tight adherence pilus pseudopilin TadF n=1 Tax=Vibrio splendidus TaxID=29497 RepID=UPI0003253439|nr:tight adherence pilus pseudopilin TadF [Vibrio splendidus]